jgi:hypothetical protein
MYRFNYIYIYVRMYVWILFVMILFKNIKRSNSTLVKVKQSNIINNLAFVLKSTKLVIASLEQLKNY